MRKGRLVWPFTLARVQYTRFAKRCQRGHAHLPEAGRCFIMIKKPPKSGMAHNAKGGPGMAQHKEDGNGKRLAVGILAHV